jgi:hypothetical protein
VCVVVWCGRIRRGRGRKVLSHGNMSNQSYKVLQKNNTDYNNDNVDNVC